MDLVGVAAVIGALATMAGVLGNLWLSTRTLRATHEVRDEVRTYNEKTTGQLAAEGETRRVEGIPHDERTAVEQRHVDEAPPVEPPQGPSR